MSFAPIFSFYLICYLLVIFSYLPSVLGVFNGIFPIFETALAFFFVTHKRKYISYLFLLFVFILLDTIQNNIFGTTALIFFLAMTILKACKQLFVFERFNELWIGYCFFCILIFGLNYLVNNFSQTGAIITFDIFLKLILTILFYPLYDFVISLLYNKTIMKYYNEKYLI